MPIDVYPAGASRPISSWMSRCQPAPNHSMTTQSSAPATASTCQARRRKPADRRLSVSSATNHATVTPTP